MKRNVLLVSIFVFVMCFAVNQNSYATGLGANQGLYGCQLMQLVVDASDSDPLNHIAYARVATPAGIWKCYINRSITSTTPEWFKQEAFPVETGAQTIAVTQDYGYIYASTLGGSVYRSTTGGASWNALSNLTNGMSIFIDSSNNIYICAEDNSDPSLRAIYYSTDGTTFTSIIDSINIDGDSDLWVSSDSNYIWLAPIDSGTAYKWVNDSGTWTSYTYDLTATLADFVLTEITVDPNSVGTVYFAGIVTQSAKLIKTMDGIQASPIFAEVDGFIGTGRVWITSDSTRIYKGSQYSEDGGNTQTSLTQIDPLTELNPNTVDAINLSNNNYIYGGSDQGVFRSLDNGVNLYEIDYGMAAVQIRGGCQNAGDTSNLLMAAKSGTFTSADGGDTWYAYDHGAPKRDVVSNATGSLIISVGASSTTKESTNSGVTWSAGLGLRAQAEGDGIPTPNSYNGMFDPNDQTLFYDSIAAFDASAGGVYKGTRAGPATWAWTSISTDIPVIYVYAFDDSGTTNIIAGYGDRDGNSVTAGAIISTNAGTSWSAISDLSGYVPRAIAQDPNNSSTFYVATGSDTNTNNLCTVFKSIDSGVTWTDVSPGITDTAYTDVVVDPDDSTKVYASCGYRVYASVNSGAAGTWYEHYIGSSGEQIDSLFMFEGLVNAATLRGAREANVQATTYDFAIGSESGLYLWASSKIWYFAEGYTANGFETYLLMENPNSSSTQVTATFYKTDGTTVVTDYTIPASSRFTLDVGSQISELADAEFSVKLDSTLSIIAERSIYGNSKAFGQNSIGVTNTSNTWYFGEGSTANGFQEYILVLNPNNYTANLALTLYDTDGSPQTSTLTTVANSRKTIDINALLENAPAVSVKLTSDLPVVAERSMYWNNMASAHSTAGTTSASNDWYLAEGSTTGTFDPWLIILNPNSTSVQCTITIYFKDTDKTPEVQYVTVPGESRFSLQLSTIVADDDFSIHVNSGTSQVVVERAMYFGENWTDGHCTMGIKGLATQWYFAEGSTNEYETWLLLLNPDADTEATATITFYETSTSTSIERTVTLPAQARDNIKVNDLEGLNNKESISIYISCTLPIAVERAMYFNDTGCHVTKGFRN